MQNLGKVVWVITLTLQCIWGDSVQATVSTTEVVKGNAVQLQIKAIGDNAQFPDIQMIDGYSVLGTNSASSSSYSYINGKMKSQYSTTKMYTFVPDQNMTIPSYEVKIDGKRYNTQPIALKIRTSNAPVGENSDMFSLQMRANKTKVMVGESLIVTVYFSLKNGVRLSQDIQYTAPVFGGFTVTETGDKKAYIKGNYQVQEVKYILTAQQEGNFTATPAYARVGVADKSRRDIFGMTFGTKWKQMASNSMQLEVLPQAQESDLVGDFTLNATIDTQDVKANKPVNLTIKIEGKGNLESFSFPKYEIDGVTIYSDEAKVETKVVDGELYSSYHKSFAFISDDDFVIPERSFSLLTPKDHKLKTLNIDAYNVTIKRLVDKHSPTVQPETKGLVQTNIQANQTKDMEAEKQTIQKQVDVKSVAWWMVVLAFVSGMLFMFALRWLPRLKRKSANPYKESEALKILYGHMGEDAQIEEMVRKLYARKNGDKTVDIDKKVLKKMVERFR